MFNTSNVQKFFFKNFTEATKQSFIQFYAKRLRAKKDCEKSVRVWSITTPSVEQRRRPAVGGSPCLALVARLAVELVRADQEVLAVTAVQLRERVPQPHHVHVLAKISTPKISTSMALRLVPDAQDCPTAKVAVTIGTAHDLSPTNVCWGWGQKRPEQCKDKEKNIGMNRKR